MYYVLFIMCFFFFLAYSRQQTWSLVPKARVSIKHKAWVWSLKFENVQLYHVIVVIQHCSLDISHYPTLENDQIWQIYDHFARYMTMSYRHMTLLIWSYIWPKRRKYDNMTICQMVLPGESLHIWSFCPIYDRVISSYMTLLIWSHIWAKRRKYDHLSYGPRRVPHVWTSRSGTKLTTTTMYLPHKVAKTKHLPHEVNNEFLWPSWTNPTARPGQMKSTECLEKVGIKLDQNSKCANFGKV